jgi:hypothetical protein
VGLCALVAGLLIAAPAAGAATWNLQSVPAPQTPTGQGFAVSCSSSTSCVAVGFSINPVGEEQPLSEIWNGTSWTIKAVPLPTGLSSGAMRAVSCTSASACTAVGAVGFGDFPSTPLAERWNGTAWKIQTVPSPSGQFELALDGVSCTSATACTAVGSASNGTHSVALAERWNGTSWAPQTIPNPATAAQIQLGGVACSSGGACIAVGHYTSSSSHFFPDKVLAERLNGANWSIQTTPLPAGTTDASLTGVSCSASNACTAVGGYSTTGAFPNKTLAERWNGTGWAIQSTPNPASGSPMFSAVSCPTATDCTAVGVPAGLGGTTVAEQWNGTTWTIQPAPAPPGLSQAQLSGVSCPAATACIAVGGARTGIEVPPSMLAEAWNGTSWSLQTGANRLGALSSELKGVACPSATFCVAIGDFINRASTTRMLAETWNGLNWSIRSVPNPSATTGVLNAVSCSSPTACTAVGSFTGAAGITTLAERWNGTSWTVQSTPNPSGSTDAVLQGVSCPSTTSCMAVGRFFNSVTSQWTRLAEQWNGTSWAIKTTQSASGETFSTLNSVSCASSTACITVGGVSTTAGAFQADRLLTEQWNGTSWVIRTAPNPAGTTFATFAGVSCSAATACTGVGGFSTTPGDEFPRAPLAERWNGTSWALQTPANDPSLPGFTGDSCPGARSCTAVGFSSAQGWNGTTWTSQAVPFLSTGDPELAAVSCSAADTCTAAGRNVLNYLIFQPFANSVFLDTMFVPLAVRGPASTTVSAPSGPQPSVKLIPVGPHEIAVVQPR